MDAAFESYIAISALIARYTRLVDLAAYDELGAMFEAGEITANRGGEPLRGAGAIAEFYGRTNKSYGDSGASTLHIVTNLEFEELTNASAIVRSCFVVLQQRPELPLQPIVCGRYVDRFTRGDRDWRYAVKHIEVGLVGDVSHHLNISL
ncbi:hypothetical protein ACFB49_33460 [Sphingomonas sp. DBB INV C78]|uniref:nuclear transport factor 2 family protein n=1 Tax=Sphingomonas sp. DBB INV C78 TaxID=3349434 RepID=UPI0036D28D05